MHAALASAEWASEWARKGMAPEVILRMVERFIISPLVVYLPKSRKIIMHANEGLHYR